MLLCTLDYAFVSISGYKCLIQILDSRGKGAHWFDLLFILPKSVKSYSNGDAYYMCDIMTATQALADLFLYSAEISKASSSLQRPILTTLDYAWSASPVYE